MLVCSTLYGLNSSILKAKFSLADKSKILCLVVLGQQWSSVAQRKGSLSGLGWMHIIQVIVGPGLFKGIVDSKKKYRISANLNLMGPLCCDV